MASERRGYLVTALLAFGAAALVFAWCPTTWPNPLPQGAVRAERSLPRLRAAAVITARPEGSRPWTWDDVLGVPGIGPVTVARWKRLAGVSP